MNISSMKEWLKLLTLGSFPEHQGLVEDYSSLLSSLLCILTLGSLYFHEIFSFDFSACRPHCQMT